MADKKTNKIIRAAVEQVLPQDRDEFLGMLKAWKDLMSQQNFGLARKLLPYFMLKLPGSKRVEIIANGLSELRTNLNKDAYTICWDSVCGLIEEYQLKLINSNDKTI